MSGRRESCDVKVNVAGVRCVGWRGRVCVEGRARPRCGVLFFLNYSFAFFKLQIKVHDKVMIWSCIFSSRVSSCHRSS